MINFIFFKKMLGLFKTITYILALVINLPDRHKINDLLIATHQSFFS